jgi:hypothetical protein
MVAIEADAALALGDRVVRELDRGLAMAAFIAVGVFEFRAGETQMIERRLHAGLIGAGPAGDESRGDGGEEQKSDGKTTKFHGFSSLFINRRGTRRTAYGFSH